LLTLAFGDVASGGLIEMIEGVIEAHHRHILSQTLAQAIGVFVGGKIQLGIEAKRLSTPQAPYERRLTTTSPKSVSR
jgi:hypothetical protein